MLSKLKLIEEESDINDLVKKVKIQTSETNDDKIIKMLKENDYNYITVIKLLMGININTEKKDEKIVTNLNQEKYTQIRYFMDEIYRNKK